MRKQRQQSQWRCAICGLFQNTRRAQHRSSFDRAMHVEHLQTAHGVKPTEEHRVNDEARGALRR
jgi:hypothetical protein